MIATNTTRFLVTNTTRLRAWTRRIDPYSATAIAVLLVIIAGGLVRTGLQPASQPTIIVVATQALPSGPHGAVRRLERAPSALRILPTAILPTAAPASTAQPAQVEQPITIQSASEQPTPAGYIAHTDQGDLFVPNDATPVPSGTTYTGPFLAPAVTEAPSGPRLCTGFGDRRDYDPAYAASPVCHQAP